MAAALALFLCAVALAPTSLLGYERGAPARTDTCRNLQPGHGRPGDHGYSLELIGRPTSYDDTTVIQVAVHGATYQGLMMQMRTTSNTSVGDFRPTSNMKRISCSRTYDTMTQMNRNSKGASTIFTWVPPGGNVGTIRFFASVLTDFSNYQMVASPELNYAAPTSDSGGDGTGTGDSPATETPSGSAGGATPMTPATTTTAAHRPDEPFVPGGSSSSETDDSSVDGSISDSESNSEESTGMDPVPAALQQGQAGNGEDSESPEEDLSDEDSMEEGPEMDEEISDEADDDNDDDDATTTEDPATPVPAGNPAVDQSQDNAPAPLEPLISNTGDEVKNPDGKGVPSGDAQLNSEVVAAEAKAFELLYNGADPKTGNTLVTVSIVVIVGGVLAAVIP